MSWGLGGCCYTETVSKSKTEKKKGEKVTEISEKKNIVPGPTTLSTTFTNTHTCYFQSNEKRPPGACWHPKAATGVKTKEKGF